MRASDGRGFSTRAAADQGSCDRLNVSEVWKRRIDGAEMTTLVRQT
jgi:hypothetical protein